MHYCWTVKWIAGSALIVPIVYLLSRNFYFQTDPHIFLQLSAPAKFKSIYFAHWGKAQANYIVSLFAVCYAAYVLTSLLASQIGKTEAAIHLAIWTMLPPICISFVRYFFFDPGALEGDHLHAAIDALDE